MGGDGPVPGPGPFGEVLHRLAAPARLVNFDTEDLPANRCIAHSAHNMFGGVSLFSYTGVGQPSTCAPWLQTGGLLACCRISPSSCQTWCQSSHRYAAA